MVQVNTIKTEVARDVISLKNAMQLSMLEGNYKEYKNAKKDLAKIAVQEFEFVKNCPPSFTVKNVPLLSKSSFRALKVLFLDKFRIKTPEEKQWKEMAQQEQSKENFKQAVRNRIQKSLSDDINAEIQPKIHEVVETKTDLLYGMIPKNFLEMLSEQAKEKGQDVDSLINDALKQIPRWFQNEQHNLAKKSVNKKFNAIM